MYTSTYIYIFFSSFFNHIREASCRIAVSSHVVGASHSRHVAARLESRESPRRIILTEEVKSTYCRLIQQIINMLNTPFNTISIL